MMKVLISDDEIQIRKGLRLKVDWEEEGFEIACEASNGQEALEKLKNMDIDIVITDVRMPIMDGIEFAKRCHLEHPNVKVIVLSGYSDFEYVRSSMIEGVKDYLLKPVAPDELVDALRRVRIEIEEEKRKQNEFSRINHLILNQLEEIREQYLLHLVKEEWLNKNIVIGRLQQLQLDELGNEEVKVQFVTVEIRAVEDCERAIKEFCLPFRMLGKEIAGLNKGTYSFYDPSYTNMIHYLTIIDSEPLNRTSPFIEAIRRHVKEYLNLEIVIGIGKVVNGYQEFKTGYISSLLSWSQSQLGSHSQVIDATMSKETFDFTPNLEKRITNTIENMKNEAFIQEIHSILEGNNKYSIITFSLVANRILFLLGSLGKKYDLDATDMNKKIWDCQQGIWELNSQSSVTRQLIELGQSIIKKVLENRSSSNGTNIVENVRRYIDEHYASEISLTTLSEQFYINSAYLSDMFKHHVGQNFTDYLLDLRMENSKKFLSDEQLKIIDVAHLVGFSNSGYFSTVFKKHVGQTPVEYRKSLNMNV